jgi:signal peptide peptidase SppA
MNAIRYRHLAERIFGTPLMIEPGKLRTIGELLLPRMLGEQPGEPAAAVDVTEARSRQGPSILDGIAVIDVFGTLVQRHSSLNALSGLTSYEQLDSELSEAIKNPSVKGVLLVIDSPGGEALGVFDFANRVFGLADNPKPIWAIAEDIATSAAYLIGSATNRFYVTQSAIVGSIGVVLAHWDWSKRLGDVGIKVTHIHAGERKVDLSNFRPMDADALEHLQQLVDDHYGLFVAQVSRNRNISERAVRATKARLYVGARALEEGMADGIQTVEETLALMHDELERREVLLMGGALSATRGETTMPAIRPHKTATSDKSWDGPANEARLRTDEDASYYRKAHAWIDPDGDPKTKAAYKFINHEIAEGGEIGAANTNGCSNGIGILNGGRGGGPGAKWWKDRSGIYDHLAKHIRDHGLEPTPLKSESEAREAYMKLQEEIEVQTDAAATDLEKPGPGKVAELEETPAAIGVPGELDVTLSAEDAGDVRREAADAERQRLEAIDALALPGHDELVLELKADPGVTPEQAARRILEAEKGKRRERLQALKQDEADLERLEPDLHAAGEAEEGADEAQRILAAYNFTRGKEPQVN